MMEDLYGSICLSDIPKELIEKSEKNGKLYLRVYINQRKQVDEYGNTHYMVVAQKRSEDPAVERKQIYLCNLKPAKGTATPATGATNVNDLPF